jgi:regulator of chromosome condensation
LFIGQVAAGQHHSIFLDTYGELLYTCGRSDSGQLGITDQVPPPGEMKTTLQLVEFDEDLDAEDKVIRRIAAGEDHSLAVTATGKLFSWGFGDEGQLGRKAEKYQPRPTLVTQYGKGDSVFVMDASAGTHHTMVLCGRNPTNENN